MKKCPYCAEEIQDEAIKCKHCGEFLDKSMEKRDNLPWYFSTSMLVIIILSVGPFGLPLVWFHPKYSRMKKIVISLIVVIASYFMYKAFSATMENFKSLGVY